MESPNSSDREDREEAPNANDSKKKSNPTCGKCGKDFTRPWVLERHLLTVHKLESTSSEVTQARKQKKMCDYCKNRYSR